MRTPFLSACLMILATLPLAAQENRITSERVSFPTGASGATIEGRVTGREVRDYVLGARGGQTMAVVFTTDNPGADFNVLPPGSDPTALDQVSGLESWSGPLPYDGDYRIRVFLYRGPADNGETAAYTIEVTVTGDADPQAASAPVFGPADFDASGRLPCGREDARFGGQSCEAKVSRYGAGATTWVQGPTGETRILYWDEGRFTTDSAAEIAVTQEADTYKLRVEGSEEVYLMPEVWLVGD